MFKIKDDVNLKILETYGYDEESSKWVKEIDNNWWDILSIDKEDRTITNYREEVGYWTFGEASEKQIQDLIKDDLVEEAKWED